MITTCDYCGHEIDIPGNDPQPEAGVYVFHICATCADADATFLRVPVWTRPEVAR